MIVCNWSLPSVTANVETDLLTPDVGARAIMVSLIVCNNDGTSTATVMVKLTDAENTFLGSVWRGILAPGESAYVDSRLFLAASTAPDKIRVLSDVANVSFIASGESS